MGCQKLQKPDANCGLLLAFELGTFSTPKCEFFSSNDLVMYVLVTKEKHCRIFLSEVLKKLLLLVILTELILLIIIICKMAPKIGFRILKMHQYASLSVQTFNAPPTLRFCSAIF